MSYAEKNLIAGERMVYITGFHWVVLIWPIILGAFFALLGLTLLKASSAYELSNTGVTVMVMVGFALLLIAAVSVVAAVISKKTTEMAVTNRRALIKVGFLNRKSYEILLLKIESIGIEENILGRILGYGSVVVRGTGGTPELFRKVKNPFEFRRQVQGQTDTSQPKTASPAFPSPLGMSRRPRRQVALHALP